MPSSKSTSKPESSASVNRPVLCETSSADEVSQRTGLLTLADDSGLEVDLLDGIPGVHSARYAGPNATDDENNNKLLMELENFKDERITARFKSVIVLADLRAL